MSNSQQLFRSGEARGTGEAQANQWADSAQNTANAAKNRTANAAQSAQENKEQAAGFLQQTGERVMDMAQGAVDTVKSTIGVGDQNPRK